MLNNSRGDLFSVGLALTFALFPALTMGAEPTVRPAEMAGYLLCAAQQGARDIQRRVLHVCGSLASVEGIPGAAFPERAVWHMDVCPIRWPAAGQSLFRHRGGPGLVAGHTVRDRDPKIHHGRRGLELQRVGERPRRGQGKRLEQTEGTLRCRTTQSLGDLATRWSEPQDRARAANSSATDICHYPSRLPGRPRRGRTFRPEITDLDLVPEHRQLQGAGRIFHAVFLVACFRGRSKAERDVPGLAAPPIRTRHCRWRHSISPPSWRRTRKE